MNLLKLYGVYVCSLLFTILIGVTMCYGQESERNGTYSKELDSLWSKNIYIQNFSNDGLWVTFKEVFDKKEDQFILLHTENASEFNLGNVFSHSFSRDSKWLAYLTNDYKLTLLNLESWHKKIWNDVRAFEFDDTAQFMVVHFKEPESSLSLINLVSMEETSFEHVVDYKWKPQHSEILISKKENDSSEILLFNCISKTNEILIQGKNFPMIKISASGNALVLLEEVNKSYRIIHYSFKNNKATVLNDLSLIDRSGFKVSEKDLIVSDDGNQVFFFRENNNIASTENGLEIWKTSDPWIHPRMEQYKNNEQRFFLTFWNVSTEKISEISNIENPSYQFNANHSHGLVYNKMEYEPQYKQFEDVDLYLRDFQTSEKKLIVKKQYNEQGFISLSPKGRYIAYFRESDWWAYDSKTGNIVNLTESLNVSFENEYLTGAADKAPHGCPGWSEDEKYIILYDEFDIWLMQPDGDNKQKITSGRALNKTYRISREAQRNDNSYLKLLQSHSGIGYNLNQDLLLEIKGSQFKTGYAIWNKKSGIQELHFDSTISEGILSNGEMMVFIKSWFNSPPSVHSLNTDSYKVKLLYQSNPEILKYDLGKAEFFNYRISESESLAGLLFFPANFQTNKKYPMIVKPYERITSSDLIYNSPSDYEYSGFNLLRFLTNNYFVFIPTIQYEMQNPGGSAVKSLIPAVDYVIENYPVDKERIGLIGHSFGGYQTAFTVTQTDMFAAAVAGAPVTDLVNFYHDVSWDWNMDQMWRIENQQFRMGNTYYKLKQEYQNNSPMHFVEKLNTPLLLWTGKEDNNVNWTQSLNMFMAMKRLDKSGELILFEEEPHYLLKKKNQENLSVKILNWFDMHLKKEWSE